jgi:predicted Zn-dependent protease
VELPVVSELAQITQGQTTEYTRPQVLKHTITHELGHAIGMDHNKVRACLMYEYSTNWSRDTAFSEAARRQIMIHNRCNIPASCN